MGSLPLLLIPSTSGIPPGGTEGCGDAVLRVPPRVEQLWVGGEHGWYTVGWPYRAIGPHSPPLTRGAEGRTSPQRIKNRCGIALIMLCN